MSTNKKTVLVTGFNKFGGMKLNPSQILVEELERRKHSYYDINLETYILPTEFNQAEIAIEALINKLRPNALLLIGASNYQAPIVFERFALNIDDTQIPDNSGYKPEGIKIKAVGPAAYATNLDLTDLVNNLNRSGINPVISNHAGTYVCNHAYYVAHDIIKLLQLNTKCIFMHISTSCLEHSSTQYGTVNIIQLILATEKILRLITQ